MPSSLHRAWRAVAHFLGESIPLPERLDMDLLGQVAQVHRLEGALAEPRLTPESPERHVSAALWERWKMAHAAGLAQSVQRQAPLHAALAALAPVPAIVLKGAALAELVYPSPGARGMGDVDLLVPARELTRALAALEAQGYRRKYPDHPTLDHPGFHERQLEGPMELDLHQAFIQPERLAIDYDAIFARALPWRALAPNAFVLAPEDAVVYACLHAAIGEFTPSWAPAIGLLDLRQLLLREGPTWGAVGGTLDTAVVSARAREWGAERMLYTALAIAGRIFPGLTASARFAIPIPFPVKRTLDAAIVRRAFPPPLEDPSRAEVLMRKGLLLNPRDRIRFAMHALSPRQ